MAIIAVIPTLAVVMLALWIRRQQHHVTQHCRPMQQVPGDIQQSHHNETHALHPLSETASRDNEENDAARDNDRCLDSYQSAAHQPTPATMYTKMQHERQHVTDTTTGDCDMYEDVQQADGYLQPVQEAGPETVYMEVSVKRAQAAESYAAGAKHYQNLN